MIQILCVGKIKESYLNELINDYAKRISRYHKIEIIEVKDSNIEQEAILLSKYIKPNDFVKCKFEITYKQDESENDTEWFKLYYE